MLTFLLAAGLAIDISHLYVVDTELQNAADAAALAGARELNSGVGGIHAAVDRAVASMNNYEVNNKGVVIRRDDVRFAINLSEFDNGGTGRSESNAAAAPRNVRFIKVVTSPADVNMLFAHLALKTNIVSLTQTAVAGQSAGLNRLCNLAPLVPLQDDASGAPLDVNPECPNKTQFTPGCTYNIRLSPASGPSGGNYLVLALGGSQGGDVARENMAIGTKTCYQIGDQVPTEPGMNAGPIRQGFNTRFDQYHANLDPIHYPPDTNIENGITYAQYTSGAETYQQPGSHQGVRYRRVVVFPIANVGDFDPGRNLIRIQKFGAFFLHEPVEVGNGGTLTAEFISERVVLGDSSYDPNGGPGIAQLTVPVLYR